MRLNLYISFRKGSTGWEPNKIKIRHSHSMADAVIDSCNDILKVKVSRPLWGVAPGQSIVCYAGKICLGGGIILSFERIL